MCVCIYIYINLIYIYIDLNYISISHRSQKNEAAKQFPTIIINQHIIMISEGSCDTEDWSNDTDNSALITSINYILKYITIENYYFKLQLYFTK